MPLTKEERHRLAVRVRLGETYPTTYLTDYAAGWWYRLRPNTKNPGSADAYVLGVLVGTYHLTSGISPPRVWECGFSHPRSRNILISEELMDYLERD